MQLPFPILPFDWRRSLVLLRPADSQLLSLCARLFELSNASIISLSVLLAVATIIAVADGFKYLSKRSKTTDNLLVQHALFLTVLLCVIGRSNAQSFKEEDDPAVDDPPSSFPSNLVLFIAIIIVLVVNPCITVALQGAAVQVWLQSLPSRVSNGATETFDHVKHLAMAKVEEFTLLVGAFLDGEAARGYGDEDDDNEGEFSLSHEEQVVAAEDAV
jgi:hypothetical protein